MKLDLAGLDHYANVIRRQVEEEFRDLTLMFILHRSGGRGRAIREALAALPKNEFDLGLQEALRRYASGNTSETAGVFMKRKLEVLGLVKKIKARGVIFINVDEPVFKESSEGLHYLYHLAWHVLMTHEKHNTTETLSRLDRSVFFETSRDRLEMSKCNMMADIFGAVIMQYQGHKNFIQTLAFSRSRATLSPLVGYKAELLPYPMVVEACVIVFEDLQHTAMRQMKLLRQAMQLAEEVSFTYDDNSIRQWWAFSTPAQEMAWMGEPQEKILGAAIYTSEDAYVRATAYLVSEFMNMEPADIRELANYNPFTNAEVSERMHGRICEDVFHRMVGRIMQEGDLHMVGEETAAMDKKLLSGNPVGWCSPMVKRAAEAFGKALAGPDIEVGDMNDVFEMIEAPAQSPLEIAAQAFHEARAEFGWERIIAISQIILEARRNGETPDLAEIVKNAPVIVPFQSQPQPQPEPESYAPEPGSEDDNYDYNDVPAGAQDGQDSGESSGDP